MAKRHRVWRVACRAALVLCAVRAEASVTAEPLVRLTAEGGYDSNVLYDGNGGSGMGRVSPDLGLRLRDPRWDARLSYGGDFLSYASAGTRPAQTAWNHRGSLALKAHPGRRLELKADAEGSYAVDPLGLARLGVFTSVGREALLLRGSARTTWDTGRQLSLSLTYGERDVRFSDGTGAGAHTPGVEAAWALGPRSHLGGAYRFDLFESFDPQASGSSRAHELKVVYRYQLDRRLEVQAEGGPALWIGPSFERLLPEVALRMIWQWPEGAARLAYTHGVGLGSTANPGISDGLEGAITRRLSRSWRVHAEAGVWRGTNAVGDGEVWGYSAAGEIGFQVASNTEIALGASRFARLDDPSPNLQRNVVGLRVIWQLPERH